MTIKGEQTILEDLLLDQPAMTSKGFFKPRGGGNIVLPTNFCRKETTQKARLFWALLMYCTSEWGVRPPHNNPPRAIASYCLVPKNTFGVVAKKTSGRRNLHVDDGSRPIKPKVRIGRRGLSWWLFFWVERRMGGEEE